MTQLVSKVGSAGADAGVGASAAGDSGMAPAELSAAAGLAGDTKVGMGEPADTETECCMTVSWKYSCSALHSAV